MSHPSINFRQALEKYLRGSRWSVYSAKPTTKSTPKPVPKPAANNRLWSKPVPKPEPKPVAIPARLRRVRRCSRR